MATSGLAKFVKVSTRDVIDDISHAHERIIFVKPAFMKSEIEALLDATQKRNVVCEIYMEPGEEAIRHGFGETEALKLLHANTISFQIHMVDRIRMAILIVDGRALVYTPNISFIEAEAEYQDLTFPNGMECTDELAQHILDQFPKSNALANCPDNVIVLPGGYLIDPQTEDIEENMTDVLKSLGSNPAVDPAKLSVVNFYRNNYKVMKMQVFGLKIDNKKITLRPFYRLLTEVNEQLKSSWSLFKPDDIEKIQDTKKFWREKWKIDDKYHENLHDAGRFGTVIHVKIKDEYSGAILKLKEDFMKYIKGEGSAEINKRFADEGCDPANSDMESNLASLLNESKDQLKAYLKQICPEDNTALRQMYQIYRHIYVKSGNCENPRDYLDEFISVFVDDKLRFPVVDDIVNRIDVKLDFYDISSEMLYQNNDFMEIMEPLGLKFRDDSTGYEERI